MGINFSQKHLLSLGRHKKTGQKKGSRRRTTANLEMYAFWTGFMSTIISLIQVIVVATKK